MVYTEELFLYTFNIYRHGLFHPTVFLFLKEHLLPATNEVREAETGAYEVVH